MLERSWQSALKSRSASLRTLSSSIVSILCAITSRRLMRPFHDEISGNSSFSPECSFLSRLSTSFSACPVSSMYLFRAATRCGLSSVFRRSRTSTAATANRDAAEMNSYISTHGSAMGLLAEAGKTTTASSNIAPISTLVAPRLSRLANQLAKSVVVVLRLSKGYRSSSDLRGGRAFRAWRDSRRRSALGFLPLNRVSSTCSSLGLVWTSYILDGTITW